ncbi:MAG: M23 family metallopeptidase [Proteobacteria bacterium]|nr:M23 family metallopeptidase [Pseudomonadota bacterium]MBU1964271.1 M23 family metallopeptidase [Pseudomonadota bacterium]
MQRKFWYFVGFLVLLLAGGGWWFFVTAGESGNPVIEIGAEAAVIGRQKALNVTFADSGRGLRRTEIVITQDNQPHVLSSIDYPEAGILRKEVSVAVGASVLKLHDGPATLTLTAVDHALWKNRTTVDRPVQIDLLPPQIFQLNTQNHINSGGTCVVAYRLSEAVPRTGVLVGDQFYSGYPVTLAGKPGYAAYFALPLDASPGVPQIRIMARDHAGNETVNGTPNLIKKRKFRIDTMVLSDGFLGQKMPEFQAAIPELRGKTPIETFVYVNTVLRADNLKTIQSVCLKSEPRQLWQGTFLRMKNAAPMALFGDHRTYLYGGKPVGESLHNGVDLASIVHAPIEAANSGIVRFTGLLGIYGNAVIIDHGLGLSTLYAHMSGIQVKPDQTVKRGEVIGLSGASGLAGGDHLHFGVAIHGEFVDPREWWDPHWIADNVTKKLEAGY